MATVDWVVGTIISVIGIFLFYKALKEPMDLLFGAIGKGLKALFGLFSGGGPSEQYEEIRYG